MDTIPFRLTFGVELKFIVRFNPENYRDGVLAAEGRLWTREHSPTLHHKYGILVREHMVKILNKNGFPTNAYKETDFSKWTVDTDGSVYPVNLTEDWYPIELKTPVLISSGAVLEDLERAVKLLVSKFELFINRSCGLHVHVGNENRGFNIGTLRNFCSLITVFENQLNWLHPPHRLYNMYAVLPHNAFPPGSSNRQRLSIVDRLQTVEELILQFHLTAGGDFDKNMAFNFFNLQECLTNPLRTIEFRQHQATLDPKSISSWVSVACNLVRLSYVDGAGIRNLIEKHIGNTNYNVVDLFKDLKLPNLAEFYAPRLYSAVSDEFEELEDIPASIPDENMEHRPPPC